MRALRSYLWLKLYEVSQCTRSTRIPMRAPDAFQPARDPGAPQPSVISMPQTNAAPSGFRLLDDQRARPLPPGCQVGTQASLSSEIMPPLLDTLPPASVNSYTGERLQVRDFHVIQKAVTACLRYTFNCEMVSLDRLWRRIRLWWCTLEHLRRFFLEDCARVDEYRFDVEVRGDELFVRAKPSRRHTGHPWRPRCLPLDEPNQHADKVTEQCNEPKGAPPPPSSASGSQQWNVSCGCPPPHRRWETAHGVGGTGGALPRCVSIVTFGLEKLDGELSVEVESLGGGVWATLSENSLQAALWRSWRFRADLVVDARGFPDPAACAAGYGHTGHHPEIMQRIMNHKNFRTWLRQVKHRFLIAAENRFAMTRAANGSCVDVGLALYCKSGKHRSVATALILRHILRMEQWGVAEVRHLSQKYWRGVCVPGRCDECTAHPTQLWESIQNAHTVWARA